MKGNIRVIDPKRDRLSRPRRWFLDSVREAMGREIAGYAIVTWDRDNSVATYMLPSDFIGRRILPSIVHDALQQHVTMMMAEDAPVEDTPPKDGA